MRQTDTTKGESIQFVDVTEDQWRVPRDEDSRVENQTQVFGFESKNLDSEGGGTLC